MLVAVLSKLNPVIYTSFRRALLGQRAGSFLLRQEKSLPVNYKVFHFLPYSTHLLSNSTCFRIKQSYSTRNAMAASGSKPVFGDFYVDDLVTSCGNALDFAKPSGVYFSNQSRSSCMKASISLRKRELPKSCLVYGCNIVDATQRVTNNNLHFRTWQKSIHTSSLSCFASEAAHDVSFDGSSGQEQIAGSSEPTIPGEQTLKLLSGACYLPHPAKEATGGEDAHFICVDEQAIGVADGVGGWAEVGIDAGEFARELMSNSVSAVRDEPKGSINPARVLEKAHSSMKSQGSSTACIIALTNEGIHAINLGDSGFMVVRDGCNVFQSPVQQHGFNFTYQLESGNRGDLPSSGQVFTIPALPGDVIIAGTDGLFDNLYNNEVTAVVVHAVRTGLDAQATAQKIAGLARQRALDKTRQSPFATAAQEAGFRYYGGKLDDITVVVSYVTGSTHV